MFEALSVLYHAQQESRLMFRERAALEQHQHKVLAQQLPWVAVHSPATAERFRRAGLPLSRWRELPPTSKAEMMVNFDTLNTEGLHLADVLRVARQAESTRNFSPTLSGKRGPVAVGLSTGTSGTQGVFVTTAAERLAWAGVVLRHLLPDWPAGLLRTPPHRIAFLLRADNSLYRSVGSRRLHFHFLDILRPLPELAAELSAYQPTLLVGPPSVLRSLLEAGASAQPERVVSVAEVLEPDDEAALRAGFGPVVQVYQATEGLLGLPCPHGKLHLNEAHVHFDFEPLGGGYVRPIVTDLRRRTQPIIRHRLDDVLLLAQGCTCGLAARRIVSLAGRQDDALLLPNLQGNEITIWPDFLRGAMSQVVGLREYRVEQTGPRELRLSLEPLTLDTVQAAQEQVRLALSRQKVRIDELTLLVGPLLPAPAGVKQRRVSRSYKPKRSQADA